MSDNTESLTEGSIRSDDYQSPVIDYGNNHSSSMIVIEKRNERDGRDGRESKDNKEDKNDNNNNNKNDKSNKDNRDNRDKSKNTVKKNKFPDQVIINARGIKIETSVLKNYATNKNQEGYSNDKISLDFKLDEVHDMLDVLAGRKHHLYYSEHVQEIIKQLEIDNKEIESKLSSEIDLIADKIKTMVLLKLYVLFPNGIITGDKLKWIMNSNNGPHKFSFTIKSEELAKIIHSNYIMNQVWKRTNRFSFILKTNTGIIIKTVILLRHDLREWGISYDTGYAGRLRDT